MERPYQRPVPGPREMRAPHHPAGSGHRESASAHTRKGHAGTTRRATGPSTRNAQTAWNGVPASEDKGHPDGTARHTQRGTRGAGRGKKGRHNTRRSLPGPAPAVPLPPVTPADLLRINDCIPQFPGSKSKNIEIKSSFNPETATRSHKYSNNPIHNPNQAAGFRSAHRLSHDGGHVQELHQGRKP